MFENFILCDQIYLMNFVFMWMIIIWWIIFKKEAWNIFVLWWAIEYLLLILYVTWCNWLMIYKLLIESDYVNFIYKMIDDVMIHIKVINFGEIWRWEYLTNAHGTPSRVRSVLKWWGKDDISEGLNSKIMYIII